MCKCVYVCGMYIVHVLYIVQYVVHICSTSYIRMCVYVCMYTFSHIHNLFRIQMNISGNSRTHTNTREHTHARTNERTHTRIPLRYHQKAIPSTGRIAISSLQHKIPYKLFKEILLSILTSTTTTIVVSPRIHLCLYPIIAGSTLQSLQYPDLLLTFNVYIYNIIVCLIKCP